MNTFLLLRTIGKMPCKKSVEEPINGIYKAREYKQDPEPGNQAAPDYLEISKQSIEEMDVEGYEAYSMKHGHHFTSELAEAVSKMMINADGSSHSWSCEEVKKAMENFGYHLPQTATIGDACYLANMAYADFYPQLLNEKQCIKYAHMALMDPDGYEGQYFLRWISDGIGMGKEIDWNEYM